MNNLILIEIFIGVLIVGFIIINYFSKRIGNKNGIKVKVIEKSFLSELKEDLQKVYGKKSIRYFESPDGNILYVAAEDVLDWSMVQITLWLLSHKKEVVDNFITGTVGELEWFKKFNPLVERLTNATLKIKYNDFNVLPSYTKQIFCWKLPLVKDIESIPPTKKVLVEEIV